ncbi:TonB-dependent receptor [Candidatus Magnetominusculus dajiuhuensis]|uniref:TonB-dependent receptor n=1 Tax=Candidatus Magnetominusculus dajiuhuensis TaxID=3137712 RepID=UPI003B4283AF
MRKTIYQFFFGAAAVTLIAIIGVLTPSDVRACASCGCTLSSDWDNLQFSSTSGLKLDLRYDYLNQNQLRSGTGTISSADASQIMNNGNPQEVEKYTHNNYLTLGADYTFSREWGVNLQVPYINRDHSTLGTASDGYTPGDGGGQYNSHTSNIGDIKLLGRYQGFTPECNLGVLFGFKLPTGKYTLTGTSTDATAPGPVAIDRGLQPGTGTTDVIIGIYYTNNITPSLDYFAQATYQAALYERDHYRPGEGVNLNLGLRYMDLHVFYPQVQLNFRYARHDTGLNADSVSTGGTLLYISPGVSVPIGEHVSAYSFVQLPVYQNVNGVQLAPRYTMSFGVRYTF